MSVTNQFFLWFFEGMNGLGGWFLFFLLALAGLIFLLYDAQKRRLPAVGWKLGVILTAALLIPAIIFRFSSLETRQSLTSLAEMIFYLGLLGGILPPVLAVGYYVTFQGLTGCPQGHVYDAVMAECPVCKSQRTSGARVIPDIEHKRTDFGDRTDVDSRRNRPSGSVEPSRQKAQAWLVSGNKSNQIFVGSTTIGRSTRNDIVLDGDATVSKEHAKIMEENGRFRLYDLGSTNGTFVNGKTVRQPTLLSGDDEIRFGDNILLRFMTTQR